MPKTTEIKKVKFIHKITISDYSAYTASGPKQKVNQRKNGKKIARRWR